MIERVYQYKKLGFRGGPPFAATAPGRTVLFKARWIGQVAIGTRSDLHHACTRPAPVLVQAPAPDLHQYWCRRLAQVDTYL